MCWSFSGGQKRTWSLSSWSFWSLRERGIIPVILQNVTLQMCLVPRKTRDGPLRVYKRRFDLVPRCWEFQGGGTYAEISHNSRISWVRLGGKRNTGWHRSHCIWTGFIRGGNPAGMNDQNNPVWLQWEREGWVWRGSSAEANQAAPSGQVDNFPFLLRASSSLSVVEGKEDFLKGVMSRGRVIMCL